MSKYKQYTPLSDILARKFNKNCEYAVLFDG